MEHRPAYKRRDLAQGHRIWLVYNTHDRVWNFQPTKKLFTSVSLIFIRSRAVFPTLVPKDAVQMASSGHIGWSRVYLEISEYNQQMVEIPIQIENSEESSDSEESDENQTIHL